MGHLAMGLTQKRSAVPAVRHPVKKPMKKPLKREPEERSPTPSSVAGNCNCRDICMPAAPPLFVSPVLPH
eukprot:354647-Chlamydomonas_euryale.AAC.2